MNGKDGQEQNHNRTFRGDDGSPALYGTVHDSGYCLMQTIIPIMKYNVSEIMGLRLLRQAVKSATENKRGKIVN